MNCVVKKYNESFLRIEADQIILEAIYNYFCFKTDNKYHPLIRSGKWDGTIHFYNLEKNLFPQGLLFKLAVWLKRQNIDVEYLNFDKSNTIASIQQIVQFSEDILKFPFPLRDYQLESIRAGLIERKCILLSPTASGKSAIIYTLLKMIKHRNQTFKQLVIVPTIALVSQMNGDFSDYSVNIKDYGKECQLIYGGEKKKIDKDIVISTWQSLQDLPKEFFMQFDSVIVDECHGGATDGKIVKKIVENCSRAKYKIGLTGTLHDGKLNEFSVNALYGKVYKYVSTKELMDRGDLTKLSIQEIRILYNEEICKDFFKKKIQLKKQLKMNDVDNTGAAMYQFEVKYINDLPHKRNLIESICKKQVGNILILFRRNSQFGFKVFEQLKSNLTDKKIFYITGKTDVEQREAVRKICENNDNAIICAQLQVFATGVNVKRLHHAIFGESCKSKVTVLQSIGRGLRKHATKDVFKMYDLVDVFSYKDMMNLIAKHSDKRQEIYEREEFEVKKFDYKI